MPGQLNERMINSIELMCRELAGSYIPPDYVIGDVVYCKTSYEIRKGKVLSLSYAGGKGYLYTIKYDDSNAAFAHSGKDIISEEFYNSIYMDLQK